MKLKRLPEDFQVEELTSVTPSAHGRFTLYRLTKRGLGTIEAIDAICRRWNLSSRRVSYGGLKDRHAVTIQYLTVAEGPQRSIRVDHFDLEPVGQLAHPYGGLWTFYHTVDEELTTPLEAWQIWICGVIPVASA